MEILISLFGIALSESDHSGLNSVVGVSDLEYSEFQRQTPTTAG